jgi:flavorubredoxin
MTALVVYESHFGNTAAVARAIAEGIGPEARAVPTDEATPDAIAAADLLVAGAPVMAFGLPKDQMIQTTVTDPKAPQPGDVSHPSLRSWLETLPAGSAPAAMFETRLWWSPGGATGAIGKYLANAGYRVVGKGEKFVVSGSYGPLKEGELDRARTWGTELRALIG